VYILNRSGFKNTPSETWAKPGHKNKQMSTKPKNPKHLVALGLKTTNAPQVIALAEHFVQQMTGNAYFTNPTPSLVSIHAQALLVDQKYHIALTHLKGASADMHVELKKLTTLLKGLAAYVETEANADPTDANKIISSAGMTERKKFARAPKTFSVMLYKQVGSVKLDNKAIRNSAYIYEMTTDPNNPASWMLIYVGNKVQFVKSGLTSGARYFFRGAVVTQGVKGAYTPARDVVIQ
jgi:hypothetical protein